jgi:hypothetical protein
MMTAKAAVTAASEWLHEMYGNTIEGILLEEIEAGPSGSSWNVTLSFAVPGLKEPVENPLAALAGSHRPRRHFKVLQVAESGEVRSMKMLEHAH